MAQRHPSTPSNRPIQRHRPDGWPLCPSCDQDHLHSLMPAAENMDRPSLSRYLDFRFRCSACLWTGHIADQRGALPEAEAKMAQDSPGDLR